MIRLTCSMLRNVSKSKCFLDLDRFDGVDVRTVGEKLRCALLEISKNLNLQMTARRRRCGGRNRRKPTDARRLLRKIAGRSLETAVEHWEAVSGDCSGTLRGSLWSLLRHIAGEYLETSPEHCGAVSGVCPRTLRGSLWRLPQSIAGSLSRLP